MYLKFQNILLFACCFMLYVTDATYATGYDNASNSPGSGLTISDANWVSIGGKVPGITGTSNIKVNAVATGSGGVVYIGGDFNTAGGITSNMSNIAQWNGSDWYAVGSGIRGSASNTEIFVLISDNAGNLFAGGIFDTAGEVSANNIAKWNGTAWRALDSGTNAVYALALGPDGSLYAAEYSNIVKWDGRKWQTLPGEFDGKIRAVVCDESGNVYVGGWFTTVDTVDDDGGFTIFDPGGGHTTVDTVTVNCIAKWDGTVWSALGTGLQGFSDCIVISLAVDSSGHLYASGKFDTAGNISAPNIAKWDGTSWSALGTGTTTAKVLIIGNDGMLYAGGEGVVTDGSQTCTISRWDGTDWSVPEQELLGENYRAVINALAIDDLGQLYAGGKFSTAGNVQAYDVARWDGTAWSSLGDMVMSPLDLGIGLDGNIYACGMMYKVGPGQSPFEGIAEWDNGRWNTFGMRSSATFRQCAIDKYGNAVVYGSFPPMNDETFGFHIGKWDGSTWTGLGFVTNGAWVECMVFDSSDNLYVGGRFKSIENLNTESIAKWDGTTWSGLGSGIQYREQNSDVFAIAFDLSGNIYAGGRFDSAGGISASNIAKWDGTAWSALGDGVNDNVSYIACDRSGNMYVGGYFDTAGGMDVNHIAMWDGERWSSLTNGTQKDSGIISSIVFDDSGNLYAGGSFSSIDGVSANNIAKWDGATWSALGSGTNGTIQKLVLDGDNKLYASGRFTIAGGKGAAYLAMCNLNGVQTHSPQDTRISRPFFNYNGNMKVVHIELRHHSFVNLKMYTLTGRLVFSWSDYLAAGFHSKCIVRDVSLSGTYIVTLQAGKEFARFAVLICN